ncbi:hypothetical protein [Chondromyces apiculatus]|uniref:Uncharacterized protein n=1 Tax=Chondromyces apiculatus DSM 436 TaxID=1192034 RepID=A0A017T620_9BACT|nr:hypothetical protein [Chondromyces apiculatus]EYF04649.1 Hypothetical protein CAP_4325 [Chondromyces apiculatus DSM 436]
MKAPAPPRITAEEAEDVLFPEAPSEEHRHACASPDADARTRCLIERRYAQDPGARDLALALYVRSGGVAGVERAQEMDGGFRGKLRLVPELPIGPYRKHLDWVTRAAADFTWFFGEIGARAGAPVQFRYEPVAWRFFRSVGRTTPSAYAQGWTVAYNVSGSLLRSEIGARETLFHEIFHLNDGAKGWSRRVLGDLYDGIVARCRPAEAGSKRGGGAQGAAAGETACFTPYAPTATKVRGGTFYAFQADNGDAVHEYAAEIAMRYYVDTRKHLRGEKLAHAPFRCGPRENQEAWGLVVKEFFGGVDLLPACGG